MIIKWHTAFVKATIRCHPLSAALLKSAITREAKKSSEVNHFNKMRKQMKGGAGIGIEFIAASTKGLPISTGDIVPCSSLVVDSSDSQSNSPWHRNQNKPLPSQKPFVHQLRSGASWKFTLPSRNKPCNACFWSKAKL